MATSEPSRVQVHKTLRKLIRDASKAAQKDYGGKLDGFELRTVTAVYARRAADMLADEDFEIEEREGELCLGKMKF